MYLEVGGGRWCCVLMQGKSVHFTLKVDLLFYTEGKAFT